MRHKLPRPVAVGPGPVTVDIHIDIDIDMRFTTDLAPDYRHAVV